MTVHLYVQLQAAASGRLKSKLFEMLLIQRDRHSTIEDQVVPYQR